MDAESLLERAAGILQCKVKDFHQAARISKSDKEKRDLLIYILWEMGLFSNQEIGFLVIVQGAEDAEVSFFCFPLTPEE